jgi:hypothetical protein
MHPRTLLGGSSATAASSTAYQQLNLFGDSDSGIASDDDPDRDHTFNGGVLTGLLGQAQKGALKSALP